jgi:CubicO group peptidase (beta-lactamase class C family)
MRRTTRAGAAWGLSIVVLGVLAAGRPHAATPPPEAQAAARVDAAWRASGAPGLSAAVAVGGRIVFSTGVGLADLEHLVPAGPATVYNIGSISKIHAAIAVMQLVEQGRVGLDDEVRRHVPEFPDKGVPLTVRQVMTHTSGIRHYRDDEFADTPGRENVRPIASYSAALALFKDDPLLFQPGAFYSYSSYAVNLLQGVVESAGGRGFEDYLRERVWEPAGLTDTQFDVPERVVRGRARSYVVEGGPARNSPYGDITYKFAGGGMLSSVEDLVRLASAFNRGRLLKPETRAVMLSAQLDPVLVFQAGAEPRRESFVQALMWRRVADEGGRFFYYHCGTVKSFTGCLVTDPERDVSAAVLANALDAPRVSEPLALAQLFSPGTPAKP